MDFYLTYLSSFNGNEFKNAEYAFKLGYFFHLFLDNLWGFYIFYPSKILFAEEFNRNPLFIWEVKKDWYGIDQEYLKSKPNWNTWEIFEKAIYNNDYLDFYPQIAINEKLKDIKNFYNNAEEISRPNKYLKNKEIDTFVDVAIKWINIGMKLIENNNIAKNKSIMDLLEEKYPTFQTETGNLMNDHEIL